MTLVRHSHSSKGGSRGAGWSPLLFPFRRPQVPGSHGRRGGWTVDDFHFHIYIEQSDANAGCVSPTSSGEELECGHGAPLCPALTCVGGICCGVSTKDGPSLQVLLGWLASWTWLQLTHFLLLQYREHPPRASGWTPRRDVSGKVESRALVLLLGSEPLVLLFSVLFYFSIIFIF